MFSVVNILSFRTREVFADHKQKAPAPGGVQHLARMIVLKQVIAYRVV